MYSRFVISTCVLRRLRRSAKELRPSVVTLKPEMRPATATPVVYGYGTMSKYKNNFSGVLGKVKDKTAKMMADAEKMQEQRRNKSKKRHGSISSRNN